MQKDIFARNVKHARRDAFAQRLFAQRKICMKTTLNEDTFAQRVNLHEGSSLHESKNINKLIKSTKKQRNKN